MKKLLLLLFVSLFLMISESKSQFNNSHLDYNCDFYDRDYIFQTNTFAFYSTYSWRFGYQSYYRPFFYHPFYYQPYYHNMFFHHPH